MYTHLFYIAPNIHIQSFIIIMVLLIIHSYPIWGKISAFAIKELTTGLGDRQK